jgi:hypothetical protein
MRSTARFWLVTITAIVAGGGALLAAGSAGAAGSSPCGGGTLSTSGAPSCTYTTDGTFAVPAGVSAVTITATGAAGQSGGACNGMFCSTDGGGGGAAAQAQENLSLPAGASSLGVAVGDIGGGGASSGIDGGGGGGAGGGASVVSSSTLVGSTSTSAWLIAAAGGGGGGGGGDTGNVGGAGGAGGSAASNGDNGPTNVQCTQGGTPVGVGGTGGGGSAAGTGGAGGFCTNSGDTPAAAGVNGGITGGGTNDCDCDGGAGGHGGGELENQGGGGGGGGGGYYGGGGGGGGFVSDGGGGGAGSSYVASGSLATDITTASASAPAEVVISWSYTTTTAALSCVPSSLSISSTSVCIATVSDAATPPSVPTGTVSFAASPTSGASLSASSCPLSAVSQSSASCQVDFTPSAPGPYTLTADYAPASDGYIASSASASITAQTPPSVTTASVPVNTASPAIIGTLKAGQTLTCSPGSWSGSGDSYAYRWSRDGTPIVNATSSTYNVVSLDQGNTLTCTVTATNAAGSGSAVTSAGAAVAVPHVPRCPAATGSVHATTLGLVKLGLTRKQAERAFTHSSSRGQKYEQFFCLTPVGVRVGYGSPKLPRRYRARVVWISTASAFYAADGVRVGATVAAAGKKLKLGKVFVIGLNDWYLARFGSVTAVLKARHGVVEEIGIGVAALTKTRSAQRTFLTSFE